MIKRVPVVSVSVRREGKRIWPELGMPFEFTEEEAERFERVGSVTNVATVPADMTVVEENKPSTKGKKAEVKEDL